LQTKTCNNLKHKLEACTQEAQLADIENLNYKTESVKKLEDTMKRLTSSVSISAFTLIILLSLLLLWSFVMVRIYLKNGILN